MSARDLQSVDTDTILNTIDELRSRNIGDILALPQIIVCGDQSSGKSSVLNAVSTIHFPSKDTLCTRFVTEVSMRRGLPERTIASIAPGSDRPPHERRLLETFKKQATNLDDISSVVDEATRLMGIDPKDPQARRFSNDILRFEVTGPQQPSLTLVDLPGLFQAPSKDQTEEDTVSVRELVLTYMQKKRSIILAVISAKSDFELQIVTKFSRRIDPHGTRTLGIITKPDKLDADSESERRYVELAENRVVNLHRGWHVLVNRDYTTSTYSQDQRDEFEKKFLSKGAWARVASNHKGVFSLKSKLSGLLRDLILEELPGLIEESEQELRDCAQKLARLGMPRATHEDRRRYVTQASQAFNTTMSACIRGTYDLTFFQSHENDTGDQRRLRAVVQNTLLQFASEMHKDGHALHIVDDTMDERRRHNQEVITQADMEDRVMNLMKRNRGRELVGLFNPLIVHDLFVMQATPWSDLLKRYRQRLTAESKIAIDQVLRYSVDETTAERLQRRILGPSLDRLLTALDGMIERLLRLQHFSHPITYSQRLLDSILQAEQALADRIVREKFAQAMSSHGETISRASFEAVLKQQIDLGPQSLDRHAAFKAIQIMRAYYKVAKENIVDNFSILAIEDCLISKLPDLLSPETIAHLDDDEIEVLAMETEHAATERLEIQDRLESATTGLHKLQGIERMRKPHALFISTTDDPISNAMLDNSDISAHDLLEPLGTEVSQLDLGFSDREDRGSVSTNDLVDRGSPKKKKKKNRVKLRDSWLENSPK